MLTRGLHSLRIGKLTVCWRDAWTGKYGLELSLSEWPARSPHRRKIEIGF